MRTSWKFWKRRYISLSMFDFGHIANDAQYFASGFTTSPFFSYGSIVILLLIYLQGEQFFFIFC